MKLYSYYRSSTSYRVRIALNWKNIDYTITPVNLLKGEHYTDAWLSNNPQGFVPMLELSTGERLVQSNTIIDWLEKEYPSPSFFPENEQEQRKVKMIADIVASDIHPLNNLRVLKYLTDVLQVRDEEKMQWYRHWIDKGFAVIEENITGYDVCYGKRPTIADIYLIPQVYNAKRFAVDMEKYPRINAVYEHCIKIKAFVQAAPDVQIDAV